MAHRQRVWVAVLFASLALFGGVMATTAEKAPAASPSLLAPLLDPLCAPVQSLATALQPIALVGPLVGTVADLLCDAGSAQFQYVTTYDPPGSAPPITKTHLGLIQVPSQLDVGDSAATDLTATISILPSGGVGFHIQKAAGAPAVLPVKVEALVVIPQSGQRTAAVGYDTLASSAPGDFNASVNFEGNTTAGVLTTAAPSSSLAIIAELFTPLTGDTRTNQQQARVNLAPVPTNTTFSLNADPTTTKANVTTNVPTKVDVHAEDHVGTKNTIVDGTIDKLPVSAGFEFSGTGDSKIVKYSAASPVDAINATLLQTDGSTILQEAKLNLQDVPTQIDVNQPNAESVKIAADGPIGVAEGGFATGGHVRLLDAAADPAYAYVVEDGPVSSKAIRALGVQSADAGFGSNLSLSATLASSPFRLKLEDGPRTVDGKITNLPSQIGLTYDPDAGHIEYTGSSAIDEINVDAADPAGLLGRATNVNLNVQDVPTALTFDFTQDGSGVAVDAHGGEIGQTQFTATNGPAPTIPAGHDGIELRDQGDPYLLAGRISGLKKATAVLSPDPDLFVDATGNKVFNADLNTREGTEDIFLRATVDSIKPATHIRVLPHGAEGSEVSYSAASATNSLAFTTNGDDESDYMEATLAPLPASINLCSSKDTACSSSAGPTNAAAVRFDASERTTINMFDCTTPLHGCTPGNATSSMKLTNVNAQTVGLDANATATSGRVFFDTDNRELTGNIHLKVDNPVVEGVTVNMPAGFKAEDRKVVWPGSEEVCLPVVGCHDVPTPFSRSGSITCPGGTDIKINLIDPIPDPDVNFFVC